MWLGMSWQGSKKWQCDAFRCRSKSGMARERSEISGRPWERGEAAVDVPRHERAYARQEEAVRVGDDVPRF